MAQSLEELIVHDTAQIHDALALIDRNGKGLVFVIDQDGRLRGLATDGDIRRALLAGVAITESITSAMKVNCVSLPVTANRETILAQLNDRIRVIPLLDAQGCLVDYASYYKHHRIPVMEPSLSGNELNYVTECIRTNWISSQGPFVKKFETQFAEYLGVGDAIAVSNGTVALHLALASLQIGPGDEVIVPDLTFAASVNAVLYVGATPVLVDVKRDTYTLDPIEVARVITPRTKAIMPVHLYGQPADLDPIMQLAREHHLFVIEDAAEALGATYQGKMVGSFGDAATFSFFGNKLITTGEGGMLILRDPTAGARAKILRDHGMDPNQRYWHVEIGYNYRLTNLQAAIGVAQLEQIDRFIQYKLKLAASYRRYLGSIPGFHLPAERSGIRNVYWLFSLTIDPDRIGLSRNELIARLLRNGIETRPLFYPLHVMPPYQVYGGNRSYPNTEWLSMNGLSLPSAITLEDGEFDYICRSIQQILGKLAIVQIPGGTTLDSDTVAGVRN